jgi:hypothetical protein
LRIYPAWVERAAVELAVGPPWARRVERHALGLLWLWACLGILVLAVGSAVEFALLVIRP